jgi:hypothetical protein
MLIYIYVSLSLYIYIYRERVREIWIGPQILERDERPMVERYGSR